MIFLFLLSLKQKPNGAVLAIIDGFGENSWSPGNSVEKAKTPNLDYLKQNFLYESLVASQQAVGLTRREPGSSSVGHQTLGLGRTTPSYYQQLEIAMNNNSDTFIGRNEVLKETFKHAVDNNGRVHFAGLCTDFGIFSHIKFLKPLFESAKESNVSEILVHCFFTRFTDDPIGYIKRVEKMFPNGVKARVASVHAGQTSLDKLGNWKFSNKTAQCITKGHCAEIPKNQFYKTAEKFQTQIRDYEPLIAAPAANNSLQPGDSLIFFNHREDQSYQVAKLIMTEETKSRNIKVTPMILYDKSLDQPEYAPILKNIVYPNSLGAWISKKGFKQLRVAEAYKKYHITSFFSGGINQPLFEGEDDIINFTSVSDTNAQIFPRMNASRVYDTVQTAIRGERYKLIAVNFANVDATGHTGNGTAVKIAVEFLDTLIGKLIRECEDHNYVLFVTSDHGNGEENELLDGTHVGDHTVNNVPFMTTAKGYKFVYPTVGRVHFIGNVAPTILYVLGIDKPPEMESSMLEIDFEQSDRQMDVTTFIEGIVIGSLLTTVLYLTLRLFSSLIANDMSFRQPGEPSVNA